MYNRSATVYLMTPFDVETEDDAGDEYPWAPQPGETAAGWAAFCCYRDLGPKRSIAATARALGRDPSVLRALSAKFSWVDRALSFDVWLDQQAVADLARGRTQMRQAYVDAAELARSKIMQRLKTLNPDEISVRDLAVWLDLVNKIERQNRGEPDKVVRVDGEINVVEQLDANARRSLMADALKVLNDRLGVRPAELEEATIDGEVVEDGGPEGE